MSWHTWIDPHEMLPDAHQDVLCYRDRSAVVILPSGKQKREQREPWVIRQNNGLRWVSERGRIIAWCCLPPILQWNGLSRIDTAQSEEDMPLDGCLVFFEPSTSPYRFRPGIRFGRAVLSEPGSVRRYRMQVYHRDSRDRGLSENERMGPWLPPAPEQL